jgi:hypothetical protein
MAWGLVGALVFVVGSGLLMVLAVDFLGPRYGTALRTHRISSVVLGVLVVGHVAVSAGLFRGYRGVWRAMHAPGRGAVPADVAHRLWPTWAERAPTSEERGADEPD